MALMTICMIRWPGKYLTEYLLYPRTRELTLRCSPPRVTGRESLAARPARRRGRFDRMIGDTSPEAAALVHRAMRRQTPAQCVEAAPRAQPIRACDQRRHTALAIPGMLDARPGCDRHWGFDFRLVRHGSARVTVTVDALLRVLTQSLSASETPI
jgi:hypothetical protein